VKKVIITIIVLIAVGALLYNGKSLLEKRKEQIAKEPTPMAKPIYIKLVKPQLGKEEKRAQFLATVSADKSIKLSTKLAGFIKKVYVEDSQKVKEGELLVKIDDKEILANINALKSALNAQKNDYLLAKSIYERNKKLVKVGGLSKEKLESSFVMVKAKRSNYENTLSKLEQLKNQLNYLSIKAPFDGIVDRVLLHEGDLAAAGRPIVSIYNGKKKLIFPFASILDINKGDKVFYKNSQIGIVDNLYKSAKNGLSVAEVKLIKNINLPIDSSLTIEVLQSSFSGCKLPSNAIVHKKDGAYIAVYKDKKFTLTKVDLLLEGINYAIIKECPNSLVAVGSERKLTSLMAYNNVKIIGDNNATAK